MNDFIKKIVIPEEYKEEFDIEVFGNNYYRLKIISVILLLLEIVIYFFRDSFYDTGMAIIAFIIVDVVMIPIIFYCYKNHMRTKKIMLETVQYAFALAILFFGMGLTFVSQKYTDLSHMYFMMVFGIVFFLYIKPLHSLFLLATSYAVFFYLLPSFLDNPESVLVLRVNSLAINIFSWIVSRLLFKLRLNLFLDKKVILKKNKELEEMVMRDSMTKLYNHETAISLLENEINQCRKERPLSIIIADIDGFKHINDEYGHLAGDNVIKKIAGAIQGVVRSSDYVCRYGGDEFLVIMPNTDIQSALACIGRLQDAVKKIDFELEITPTLSGGVSQYNKETLKALIAVADAKLYLAKKAGRNNFK